MEYMVEGLDVKDQKDGTMSFTFTLIDKGPLAVATDKDKFTVTASAVGFSSGLLKVEGVITKVAPAVATAPVAGKPPAPPAPVAPKA